MSAERAVRYAALAGLAAFAIAFPFFASSFWVVQIGIKSLWLAIVALSLTFLAGYAGMLSLAQVAIYGTAGYTVANLTVKQGADPWLAALAGVVFAVVLGAVLGAVAVRTYGIYFLMITLAYAAFGFFFVSQARHLTNGHTGLNGVVVPEVGSISLRDPTTFYFAVLGTAVLAYLAIRYVVRTPFGIAVQGIRDNPLRMAALGFNVPLHRVLAFTFGALVAAVGGVFAVWYNGRISPGSVGIGQTIDILIIAVIGGLTRLEGAFAGALVFTLLRNYANDFTDRYNSLIGAVFLLILLLSPAGLAGIWEQLVGWARRPLARVQARGSGA